VIEKQLEDRMRSALTDEPPLGFDPDEVADRAGRRRRQRRATFGAAAGVLVLAVGAVVVGGARGGQRTGIGTQTSSTEGTVCQSPGPEPTVNFPGSAATVARLDAAVPGLLAEHVSGVPFEKRIDGGNGAYDCPPTVDLSYAVRGGTGEFLSVTLIHRRDRLDLAGDHWTADPSHELVSDEPAADGARIRVYRNSEPNQQSSSVVLRFGADGMITEAYVIAAGDRTISEAQLTALATDPELRFDLPR
jgi:hypothetical protein